MYLDCDPTERVKSGTVFGEKVFSSEKKCGKHPTQKPLEILDKIILASTKENDLILDPFCGSSTTGISAVNLNRKYVGIIQDHCRGIQNRYFVAFKYEGNKFIPHVYQPCKQEFFDTYEEALEYIQEDFQK